MSFFSHFSLVDQRYPPTHLMDYSTNLLRRNFWNLPLSYSHNIVLQLSDFAVQTLCSALDQNSSLKSLSIENNRVSPNVVAELFEAAASPNNGLIEMRSDQSQVSFCRIPVKKQTIYNIIEIERLEKNFRIQNMLME